MWIDSSDQGNSSGFSGAVTLQSDRNSPTFSPASPSNAWKTASFISPDCVSLPSGYTKRQDHALHDLQALRHAADLGEQHKLQHGFITKEKPCVVQPREIVGNYADPLSPLKERDLLALAQFFERSDMRDIETDLAHMLLKLQPEPCWEEDPFEFLKEFL